MNITIEYEDFHQSQQELNWFNREKKSDFEINQIRTFIKDQFIEALDILSENSHPNLNYKIKLLRSLRPEMQNNVAYFNLEQSNDDKHQFYYYLNYAFEHIFAKSQNQSGTNIKVFNVWIHELAHSFDRLELDKLIKLGNNSSIRLHAFLTYLYKFRAEGIAVFIEGLFDIAPKDIWYIDDKYLKMNEKVIENFSYEACNEDNFEMFPYWFGKNIIFNCLFYKLPDMRDNLKDIYQKIEKGENVSIVDFTERFNLSQLYSISLEDWIFVNLQKKIKLPIKIDISSKLLSMFFQLQNDEDYVSHFKYIYEIICDKKDSHKDERDFPKYLKGIIGYAMTDDEITSTYQDIIKAEKPSSCYVQLLKTKYKEWEEDKNSTAALQLTYAFDTEDAFDDTHPIVGRIDDMLVLSFKNKAFNYKNTATE